MQSVRQFHPEIRRVIVLSDVPHSFDDVDLAADVLPCDDLGINLLENMKLWYSVMEFNTSVKPYCFTYFFSSGYDQVCYLDPDIMLFQPIERIFRLLNDYSCVLTPHMMKPLQDGKEPSDLTIMKSGVYNLGFLALRNDPDGRALAKWWEDRCFLDCRVDIAQNLFTDQRWMDLAPAFISRPFILRHVGYNVAYWNIAHRDVACDAQGTWRVNGRKLFFFHFSGIKPDDPSVFSKHQNRFYPDNLGSVAELCDIYRKRVLSNEWRKYSKLKYGFGFFKDGRPIENAMRRWLVRAVDEGKIDKTRPISIRSDFFDGAEEATVRVGVSLTRFMYQFWLDRKDLRDAFNVLTPVGAEQYRYWFLKDETVKDEVDSRTLEAATTIQSKKGGGRSVPKLISPALWPRLTELCWQGKATDVLEFLKETIAVSGAFGTIFIPYLIGILWERRRDLQDAFQTNTIDGLVTFVGWSMTSAIVEGTVLPDVLTGKFLEYVIEETGISHFYNDVPITNGMIATRGVDLHRSLPARWDTFPVDRLARLAHAFWYAFVAPKHFKWPQAVIEPVLRYFWSPSNIQYEGYRLARSLVSIWELRSDLQRTFSLSNKLSIWSYIKWLMVHGLEELGLELNMLDEPPASDQVFDGRCLFAVRCERTEAF